MALSSFLVSSKRRGPAFSWAASRSTLESAPDLSGRAVDTRGLEGGRFSRQRKGVRVGKIEASRAGSMA